ncbi:hypothetical protein CPB83DRAFT_753871, partial [Crepidotus variabilis]
VDRNAALEGKNDPLERWRRAVHFIIEMMDKNPMLRSEGVEVEAEDKYLETQHWLEMIDEKHRYGSNRLNYLVKINDDGKLLWSKNDQPVDTTAGNWKDSGDGQGVVPESFPTKSKPQEAKRMSKPVPFSRSASGSSSSSEQANAATHYAGDLEGKSRWSRYIRRYFTPRGLMDRLLRKTVQKNTWMYVSVINIFIGIKGPNRFLAFIKHHFHKFLEVLEQRGVDMHKIQISKAEAALWGYVLDLTYLNVFLT